MQLQTQQWWPADNIEGLGSHGAWLALAKEESVEPPEQLGQRPFIRGRHDDHAATRIRREAPIVEVVAVERQQRPAPLSCKAVVLAVGHSSQIVVLQDEQHIPGQPPTHERHEARRHVRIGVDARLARAPLEVSAELRGESPHGVLLICLHIRHRYRRARRPRLAGASGLGLPEKIRDQFVPAVQERLALAASVL